MQDKRFSTFQELNQKVISCVKCPRLVAYRESVVPKKPFECQGYWHKPVPGFGDPHAWLMGLGLAPASHGGNRTGRIFTGDRTSKFLFEGLHAQGFANKAYSETLDDGLLLKGLYLTAMVKCAPPKDKPLPEEFRNCHPYFQNEYELLSKVTHFITFGKLAFDALKYSFPWLKKYQFAHGRSYKEENTPIVFCCYHPSPQNTNTGKLTQPMFQDLLVKIKTSHISILEQKFTIEAQGDSKKN